MLPLTAHDPNLTQKLPKTSLGLERGSEEGVSGSGETNDLKSSRGSKVDLCSAGDSS